MQKYDWWKPLFCGGWVHVGGREPDVVLYAAPDCLSHCGWIVPGTLDVDA